MYLEAKESPIKNATAKALRAVFGFVPMLFFSLGVLLRNGLYGAGVLRSHKLPFRVISVGNLSVGGTGKTPTAELLLRECAERGLKVGYLSRGYGRSTTGYVRVDPANSLASQVGDEALQVATKFPAVAVAVCEDRVTGAHLLHEQTGIEVLVLDDAFQHRAIARDLDIVTLDASRLPWKDWPLPLGNLREPVRSLKRAQFVLVNKVVDPNETRAIKKRLPNAKMAFTKQVSIAVKPFNPAHPTLQVSDLHQQTVVAFSALGNNRGFLNHLLLHGVNLARFYSYPDHHNYRQQEVERMLRRFEKVCDKGVMVKQPILITTEKDYTRLRTEPWFSQLAQAVPFYYLEIGLEVIKGQEAFAEVLASVVPAQSNFDKFATRKPHAALAS